MNVGRPIEKQSAEIKDWGVDFIEELAEGQTLTGTPTFRAIREADGQDVTDDIKQGATSISGTAVVQLIKGGDGTTIDPFTCLKGKSYLMELSVTDSVGRVHEAERRLIVRDVP